MRVSTQCMRITKARTCIACIKKLMKLGITRAQIGIK
jgi:hypothetical protein